MGWCGGKELGVPLYSTSGCHFLWHIWPNAPQNCLRPQLSLAHVEACVTETSHFYGAPGLHAPQNCLHAPLSLAHVGHAPQKPHISMAHMVHMRHKKLTTSPRRRPPT